MCSYWEASKGFMDSESEDHARSMVKSRENIENRSMPGHECLNANQ